MKPLDTLPKLKQMLCEAGFDAACPSPAVAWRVFQAYLDIPVQCEKENALFQVGDFSTDHKAYFDFCREFCLRAADDVVWSGRRATDAQCWAAQERAWQIRL